MLTTFVQVASESGLAEYGSFPLAMSLHELAVTPRDVSATDLGLLVAAAAPAPLAELTVRRDGFAPIQLGVLGASHVVVVGDGAFTEQVSCDALADGGRALPVEVDDDGYAFNTTIRTMGEAPFRRVAASVRTASVRQGWICGAFPTDAAALTALCAEPAGSDGWAWRSWHLYPHVNGGGTVVRTESRWSPSR